MADEQSFNSMEEVMAVVMGRSNPSQKSKQEKWYNKSLEYWGNVEASVNGVLGGFEEVTVVDIKNSTKLLREVFPALPADAVAVDCGAGIGRISRDLLQHHFARVDMVEPDARYLEQAKTSVPGHKLGDAVLCGLQDFHPKPARYHCVWVQWVLNYLVDDDLVAVFRRLRESLVVGGRVIVKENTTTKKFILDNDDTSVTRPDSHFRKLFQQSGFVIARAFREPGLPDGLFPVFVYVLAPDA